MPYWQERVATAANIRRLESSGAWRRYEDKKGEDGSIIEKGCGRDLNGFLIEALNSTNLMILAGAGSSFAAINPAGQPQAPGWKDLWDAVSGKDTGLSAAVLKIIPDGTKIENIEKLLTQCKLYVALYGTSSDEGDKVAKFIDIAERAILERVNFVSANTSLSAHEMLLRKIARRGAKKPRARIYTTNYDLCFERAAERRRFIVIDGFSHATPQSYDRSHFGMDIVRRDGTRDAPDYVDGVFHLYKLHGSLDWRRLGHQIVRSTLADGQPVLIYPRDSKYQEAFEPPYLDMMSSFQGCLREPDTTLIVSGFGFNDSHISQPLLVALESNVNFRLLLCDPVFIPNGKLTEDIVVSGVAAPDNPMLAKLIKLAGMDDPRIAVLNARFEDLVWAMPDLVAETERERQAERIRQLAEMPSAKAGRP